jgi:hypothetical protein
VSVEVSWQGLPPEQVLIGFRRVVWARTPAMEAEYVRALFEGREEGTGK